MDHYTIVVMESPEDGYVDTWTYLTPEQVAIFLAGRDTRRYAIFKNYFHVQLPTRPLSTDHIKDILISFDPSGEQNV